MAASCSAMGKTALPCHCFAPQLVLEVDGGRLSAQAMDEPQGLIPAESTIRTRPTLVAPRRALIPGGDGETHCSKVRSDEVQDGPSCGAKQR